MCLWLLTACLGLLPTNPAPPAAIVVVTVVPTPILQPTTAAPTTSPPNATTTTTTVTPTTPTTASTTASTTTTTRPTSGNNPLLDNNIMPTLTIDPTLAVTPTQAFETNSLLSTITPLVPNTPTVYSELLSVVLCNNPDVICLSNPNENATGPFAIDPRFGTTQAPSAAFQLPPITGYSAQVPLFDTAVRFPREKRDTYLLSPHDKLNKEPNQENRKFNKHIIRKRQSCRCVTVGTCVRTTYGAGSIDIRIVTPVNQCPSGQEYCCGSTTSNTTIACGTLQTVPSTAVVPAQGQANFGEYPWQALILTRQNGYIGGGVLIDSFHILTVTHRLLTYVVSGTAPNVKVRLGEWDAAGTYEPVPYQEYTVARVFTHPSYNSNTLQYDITVLRLSAAVPYSPAIGSSTTINRACLPPTSSTTYIGQRCWVSGWGKDMFGLQGEYQQILKEVDVPIVASGTCQAQMQAARLGSSFVLDTTSFICAGGEANKDSCTGDGGSGLVCQVNGQWVVVGLVAWGLGCANANVPAAYVNVAALLPWIQQQVGTA